MSEQGNPSSAQGMMQKLPSGNLSKWVKGKNSVANRLQSGVIIPDWKPKFQIPENPSIFAIGSCFARHIERILVKTGQNVLSVDAGNQLHEIRQNTMLGLLNQYNPASIHQELDMALKLRALPDDAFVQLAENGKFTDLFMHPEAPNGGLDHLKERRQSIAAYFEGAFKADVVIITLGLIETWYDFNVRLALNSAPSPRILQAYPKRYGCKVLRAHECKALLGSIVALLKKHAPAAQKVIITVSPVAMERTFTRKDVVIANLESKSTLRAVAGEIADGFEHVEYFPSYDAAMMSDPSFVWAKDRRNVSDEFVSLIMTSFLKSIGIGTAKS